MAEAVPEQKDENIQVGAPESSPEATQVAAAKTPTAEDAGASKSPENKVPQGRFNEVIQERNSEREARERLEARIRELELGRQEPVKRQSVADLEVKRLVEKLGMEESAAREIVATYENLNMAQHRQQEALQGRQRAESWATQKAEKDPVYKEIEAELDRSFTSMKPEMQQFVAQNADALEMFYESIKAKHLAGKSKEAYAKGAQATYESKMTKQAMSSVPGGSPSGGKTALSRKAVAEMDVAEYAKRLPEINEAVRNGTLK